MSVLKRLRPESNFEVFNTAMIIRREFTIWFLRDFGIKAQVRNSELKLI